PPPLPPFPYTTLFRSKQQAAAAKATSFVLAGGTAEAVPLPMPHLPICTFPCRVIPESGTARPIARRRFQALSEYRREFVFLGIRSEEHTSELQSRVDL